ncbi:unnamed protein product [Mytilus coruscus]|uniref:Ig-like domain-containing protein n=1 Tax=Mytilus coruscus TaxID=42192 RepID=A0A6J8C4K6_MYTCO|nr:unnamed protein product [Mytilus coruscus]
MSDVNKSIWNGPAHQNSFDTSPFKGTNVYGRPIEWNTSVYAVDENVNSSLSHQNRLKIVDKTNMGGSNLQIVMFQEVTKAFTSVILLTMEVIPVCDSYYNKKCPSNMTFLNETKGHILNGIENNIMRIICIVHSGKPPETLSLRRNNKIVKTGEHGNKPVILTAIDSTDEINEGEKKNLCCYVDSNPVSITTRLVNGSHGIFVKQKVKHMCFLIEKVSGYDHGNYTYIAENEIESDSVTIILKVKYPPYVHLHNKNFTIDDETRTILCKAEGFPSNYTYGIWEHCSEFNEHIRYLNSTEKVTLILPKINAVFYKYQDSGIYICMVTNGISNKQHFQQGKAYVVSEERNNQMILTDVRTVFENRNISMVSEE